MLIMRLSGLLSKIVVARYILPYEYGILTLITISLPNMFQYITNFCLYDILSHSKEGRNYFGFAILFTLTGATIIVFGVFAFHEAFFNFLNLPLDSWKILFLAFTLFFVPTVIIGDIIGLYRGLKKYAKASILSSLPPILKLSLILIIVCILGYEDFIAALMIFAIPPLIALFITLIKDREIIISSLNFTVPSKKIFLFGTSIFVVNLFGGLNQIFNKIVVSHDLGVVWQGYFDVSLTLVAILSFPLVAMQFVSVPEATSAENEGETLTHGDLKEVVRGLFSFLVFCTILLCFYDKEFVELLFGHKYIAAADYVPILAVGYIFLFVQQFLAYINVSSRDPKEYKPLMYVTLICLVASPLVTHALIKLVGFMGAYVSFTSFLIVYTTATILSSPDLSPVRALFHKIDGLVIASIVTFLFLYVFRVSFFCGVVLSSIIFTLLIFSLKYLDKRLVLEMFAEKET